MSQRYNNGYPSHDGDCKDFEVMTAHINGKSTMGKLK